MQLVLWVQQQQQQRSHQNPCDAVAASAARLSVLLHNWSSISIFNIFVPLLIFHHKLDNLFMF